MSAHWKKSWSSFSEDRILNFHGFVLPQLNSLLKAHTNDLQNQGHRRETSSILN